MSSASLHGRRGSLLPSLIGALTGFVGVALAVGRALEPRPELRLSDTSDEGRKFAWYRAHADEYDLVYVGTSRVHRGFDPAVFDARMAELGQARRSFNFGLVGMNFVEMRQIVGWILEHRPDGLDVLLIDPSDRAVDVDGDNWLTQRDVAWHDLRSTRTALDFTLRAELEPGESLTVIGRHLLGALRRATHVGVGAGLLERALDEAPAPAPFPDGFGAWEATGANRRAPEARAARRSSMPEDAPWEAMQSIEELARRAGVRVLFALPPTPRPLAAFHEAHERGQMSEFLTFLPRTHAEFFTRHDEYFYDQGHLNSKGAALFSRRLAEAVAEQLAER